MSKARVKRKGQVAVPLEFRWETSIEEGTVLDIKSQDGALILRPEPPIEPGEVVGKRSIKDFLQSLIEFGETGVDGSSRHSITNFLEFPADKEMGIKNRRFV